MESLVASPAEKSKVAVSSVTVLQKRMAAGFPAGVNNRISLQKREGKDLLPMLNETQINSFKDFFQEDIPFEKRRNIGLQYLFKSTFPFESSDGKVRLEADYYKVGSRSFLPEEALEKDKSYTVQVRALVKLFIKATGEIKEQEVFICDIPYMTTQGTFIINGAERVVISQIHRSPGVIFDYNERLGIYHSRIIPDKGPWLEFEIIRDVFYVRIDRKARVLLSVFLSALGIETREDFIALFLIAEEQKIPATLATKAREVFIESLLERRVFTDLKRSTDSAEEEKPTYIVRAGDRLTEEHLEAILAADFKQLSLISEESLEKYQSIINTLEKEPEFMTQEDACKWLHHIIKGSHAASGAVAIKEVIPCFHCETCEEKWLQINYMDVKKCPSCGSEKWLRVDRSVFFHPANYSLGEVGRYKIDKKFGSDLASLAITLEDVLNTVRYLLNVKNNEVPVDDIDHLGNRRIRSVGEQLVNHLKPCFVRMERLAKDRITIQNHSTLTPQNLISVKPIAGGINEFFGTSQLSQFMDQTNPLSSVTHKRRLSALGPGGVTRERAGFEVRDIHYTHYSRMCLIETPEGPNIGLIVSLASHARINPFGFIEAPYYKVKAGKVTGQIEYLSAIEEDRFAVAPIGVPVDDNGKLQAEMVPVRKRGNYPMHYAKDVDYMDVAANQIISLSASLIPFLEHDDANRALMGCNMMRQAVPLLFPQAPIVGTGLEHVIARSSGFCKLATRAGTVKYVDNERIELAVGEELIDVYRMKKTSRTNQDTFYNQRPQVIPGEKVEEGKILSSGPAIVDGDLALGRNVLVAFMTWEGYNYEDAILMSESLLKEDAFTSIHIEELDVEARETKLGMETITRDIPNISDEDYRELDERGIVNIGTRVKSGNILVGKLTPKSVTDTTPEFRLLYSIFGEKAKDAKDSSLRVPHGTEGIVVGVRHYTRENRDDLRPGTLQKVKIYLAKKRRLREGDKFAGRHGNKGIVSKILPIEDMPYLSDGTPIDIVLNPLSVPSRMNIGQVMEMVLGMVASKLNIRFATPVFNSKGYDVIKTLLKQAELPEDGKYDIYDGRTGTMFRNKVTVGVMYYMKLAHLADDKIHARSTGPYSLVTQQPLGGKAQFGGQRVGEMEVWAVEAYGAANILQEFLTVKSDAIEGRTRIYEAIVKGDFVSTPGVPESFNVLVHELRGLGLNIEIFDEEDKAVTIIPQRRKEQLFTS